MTDTTAAIPPLLAGTWQRLDGNRLQWISEPAEWGTRDLLRLGAGKHPESGHFVSLELAHAEDIDVSDAEAVDEAFENASIIILPANALPYLHKALGAIIAAESRRVPSTLDDLQAMTRLGEIARPYWDAHGDGTPLRELMPHMTDADRAAVEVLLGQLPGEIQIS